MNKERISSDEVKRKPKNVIWVLIMGFLLIAVYFGDLILAIDGQERSDQSLIAIAVWSGVFFAVLWRYRSKNGWAGFFIGIVFSILFVTFADVIGAYVNARSNNEVVLSEFENLIDLSTNAYDEEGLPTIIPKIDTEAKSSGDAGIVEAYSKKYWAKIVELRNEYITSLDSIKFEEILTTDQLKRESGLMNATQIVSQATEVNTKYNSAFKKTFDQMGSDFYELELSDPNRQTLIDVFERSYKRSRPNLERLLHLESQRIEQTGRIISFLTEIEGSWEIQGEFINFDTDNQGEAYEILLAELDQIYVETDNLLLDLETNVRKKISDARE